MRIVRRRVCCSSDLPEYGSVQVAREAPAHRLSKHSASDHRAETIVWSPLDTCDDVLPSIGRQRGDCQTASHRTVRPSCRTRPVRAIARHRHALRVTEIRHRELATLHLGECETCTQGRPVSHLPTWPGGCRARGGLAAESCVWVVEPWANGSPPHDSNANGCSVGSLTFAPDRSAGMLYGMIVGSPSRRPSSPDQVDREHPRCPRSIQDARFSRRAASMVVPHPSKRGPGRCHPQIPRIRSG